MDNIQESLSKSLRDMELKNIEPQSKILVHHTKDIADFYSIINYGKAEIAALENYATNSDDLFNDCTKSTFDHLNYLQRSLHENSKSNSEHYSLVESVIKNSSLVLDTPTGKTPQKRQAR